MNFGSRRTKIILAVWVATIVAFLTAIISGKILIKKMKKKNTIFYFRCPVLAIFASHTP